MATRKKVRTVTVLFSDGRVSREIATTGLMNAYRSLYVTYEGKRCAMYFHHVGFEQINPGPRPVWWLPPNDLATPLAHAPDTQKGPTRRRQLLRKSIHAWETVVGEAIIDNLGEPARYVRVVSIKPLTDRAGEVDLTKWCFEQFGPDHTPYPINDFKGTYIACEHPDTATRDAWLVMCRLRFG